MDLERPYAYRFNDAFRDRPPASPRLTGAYLRLPLSWRLFGRQFLVIAER
jgi:hypothetical protein